MSTAPRSPRTSRSPHAVRVLIMLAGLCIPLTPGLAAAQDKAPNSRTPRVFLTEADRSLLATLRAPLAPAAVDGDLLPLSRITLYRSGVGAFERQGLVQDAAQVQLRFDVSQINDILKSLQLLDLDGGRVDSVSYASKDPLKRRLNSFNVPIADAPSVPELLSRLRGSALRVETFAGHFEGTILAVETRTVSAGKDKEPVPAPFVSLVTSTGIRTIAISDIQSFELLDKALAAELGKALAAVADARADRVKTVDLSLSGNGARRVVVRYVHETPVWKTSYRLLLPDSPAKADDAAKPAPAKDQLTLQGWAIVENTTDNDWKDVRLSLVSGRPVSFQMDLSEPLYLARPTVPVPTIPGVRPKTFDGGLSEPRTADSVAFEGGEFRPSTSQVQDRLSLINEMAAKAGAGAGRRSDQNLGMPRALAAAAISAEDLQQYSPAAAARAGEVGEVFFFEVTNPVTVERQRSAMIPFLTSPLEGRRVSIFNHADRADHPMRGVEITNTSSVQLLPGPLAVFDGTAYAGDAQIGQVSPGDKRLLAYALDLDVGVISKFDNNSNITKVRIIDGVYEVTSKSRNTATFTFTNKDLKRERTIVVEHPKLNGWMLVGDLKPAEQTQDLYRFEVNADAGKPAGITIAQEQIQSQRVGLANYNVDQLLSWHKAGRLSDAVLAAARDLAKRQAEVRDAERALSLLDEKININTAEQTRVSQTMERLPQNAELYNDYMKELKEATTTLKTLRSQRGEQSAKVESLKAALNEFMRALKAE